MLENVELEKNGYNKKQVEDLINDIKFEYSKQIEQLTLNYQQLKERTDRAQLELNEFKKKDSQISGALVAAVETAQNIEKSSRNIYELEIQRVKILYNKWENFLNELLEKYPLLKNKFDEKRILKIFSENIERTLSENFSSVNGDGNGQTNLQNLIKKMSRATIPNHNVEELNKQKKDAIIVRNSKPKTKTLKKFQKDVNYLQERKRLGDFKVKIKPIAPLKLEKTDGYDTLVDKFLSEEMPENVNAYEKAIVKKKKQQSGFDLQEALNPKENLEEIMKAFDFFEQDD